MIVLAILAYAAFVQGGQFAWWVFVGAAIFDLAFVEEFGEALSGGDE